MQASPRVRTGRWIVCAAAIVGLTVGLATTAAAHIDPTAIVVGKGYGPGDGTGNDHQGPADGTGYGPGTGDCLTAAANHDGYKAMVAGRNGHGGAHNGAAAGHGSQGRNGPGDGTGNTGHGPGDGTGASGDGPGDGTGNKDGGPADGTGYGPGTGDCPPPVDETLDA